MRSLHKYVIFREILSEKSLTHTDTMCVCNVVLCKKYGKRACFILCRNIDYEIDGDYYGILAQHINRFSQLHFRSLLFGRNLYGKMGTYMFDYRYGSIKRIWENAILKVETP